MLLYLIQQETDFPLLAPQQVFPVLSHYCLADLLPYFLPCKINFAKESKDSEKSGAVKVLDMLIGA